MLIHRTRLSLALYNQFEHPDGTEVGGQDWEEVKEIYAQARALAALGDRAARRPGGWRTWCIYI